MTIVFKETEYLSDSKRHYCPGCGHGIAHRIIGEVLEELEILDETITVGPVGCSGVIPWYCTTDALQALHGRAAATATAVKAVHPDKIVLSHQGDGDLLSIGTAETVHAAARGTNITVIFINNAIYGMTGGQMAATTLLDQKSSTCKAGRKADKDGYPIRAAEMLATLDGPAFIARGSLHDVKNVLKSKQYIKKAFQYQKENKGYSFVELLSPCPTNWGMSPVKAMEWIENKMTDYYPLGVKKEV